MKFHALLGLRVCLNTHNLTSIILVSPFKITKGPSINDVTPKEEGGGTKNGILGRFSRLNLGDMGWEVS